MAIHERISLSVLTGKRGMWSLCLTGFHNWLMIFFGIPSQNSMTSDDMDRWRFESKISILRGISDFPTMKCFEIPISFNKH